MDDDTIDNNNMNNGNRHICCTICRIPIRSQETKLYYCVCGTIICDVCERIRTCPGCTLGHGSLKRVFLVFKDEDEQDKAVKEHLKGTYLTSDILIDQYDHLTQEIQACHNVTEKLNESVEMVKQAADLAKKRRVDVVAKQEKRLTQLESLRALIRGKEEELRNLQQANSPT